MSGIGRVVGIWLLALAAGWGCAAPLLTQSEIKPDLGQTLAPRQAAEPGAAAIAANQAAMPSTSDPQAWVEVFKQLQSLREMDPAAFEQLQADLQQTDPKLWPAMVQSFRAALAYRQRSQSQQVGNPVAEHRAPPIVPAATSPLPGPANRMDRVAPLPGAIQAAASSRPPSASPHTIAIQPNVPNAKPQAENPLAGSPQHSVVLASTAAASDDWQQQLAAAAKALEQELNASPSLSTGDRRHVYLRLMHLAAGQCDAALRPIPGMEPAEQEFWSQQLFGLAKYLDIPSQPDRSRRAAEASRYLNDSLPKLAQLASLTVKNIAFCSEVSSYGVLTRFDKAEFQPGQQVLLYAEVENFVTESTPKGHHTALASSYQIFDSRGQRVQEHEFPLTEEFCLNPRRDFFVRYFLRLPDQIYEGQHTLQLTIEDTLGHKVGQAKIEFQVRRAK
jgi:hypothetical protein